MRTDLDQPESPTWFPVAGSPSDLEYGWLGHDCHCADRVGDVWFGARVWLEVAAFGHRGVKLSELPRWLEQADLREGRAGDLVSDFDL